MSERPKVRLAYFIPILNAALGCLLISFATIYCSAVAPSPQSTPTRIGEFTEVPITSATGTLPAAVPTNIATQAPTEAATQASASCSPFENYQVYIVQAGDTLQTIARATNLKVDVIVEGNCLSDSTVRLHAGDELHLPTDVQIPTPNPTQSLNTAFEEVNRQFQQVQSANIAYNIPQTMKRGETITIELLLNPSSSQAQLATQLVERNDFLTSTAEAGQMVTKSGGQVQVITSAVEITDRMKAVLKSQTPGAFEILELHDSAEQPISSLDTTKWRWSVTANEAGEHTLELILNRLVKYERKEYWVEVQSYHADIHVKVTPVQWLESLDWKWILGILLTALLIPLFFRWYDSRRKQADEPAKAPPAQRKPRKK